MNLNNIRFFFILINLILTNILYFGNYSFISEFMKIFEAYILIVSLLLLFFNIKHYGFFHIMVFFNATFFLFAFGKVPASLFNTTNILEFNSLVHVYFTKETLIEALLISMLSLLITNLFSMIFIPKKLKIIQSSNLFINFGKKLMLFSFPLIFIKLYLEFKLILSIGYVAYYAGGTSNLTYSFPLIGISHIIFSFGYFLFLAGIPKQKTFRIYSYIFIFIMMIDALKGSRSSVILPILFYFWYLGNFYIIDMKKYKKNFLILSILLISFSQFYAHSRLDSEKAYDYSQVLNFLTDQGRSISLISLYIDNKKSMPKNDIGYIFEPLTFPYLYITHKNELSHGQSLSTVQLRENLNHRLTFFLNKEYYLYGGGLGSSYIAEMYEFGYLGIVIFSIFLSFLIGVLYKYSNKRIILFFSYLIVTHILIISRAEYFMNMWTILKYTILYMIFYYSIYLLKFTTKNRTLICIKQ